MYLEYVNQRVGFSLAQQASVSENCAWSPDKQGRPIWYDLDSEMSSSATVCSSLAQLKSFGSEQKLEMQSFLILGKACKEAGQIWL